MAFGGERTSGCFDNVPKKDTGVLRRTFAIADERQADGWVQIDLYA